MSSSLPFRYYDPYSEGPPIWICDYDEDMNITSVLMKPGVKDIQIIKNMETAMGHRDFIVKAGWRKLRDIKISVKTEGEE